MKRPLRDELSRWLLTWLLCSALDLGLAELLKVDSRWWLAVLVLLFWCALLAVSERVGSYWAMLGLWALGFGLCLLLSDREALGETAQAIFIRLGTESGYGELILLLLCTFAALPLSDLLRYYWVRVLLSVAWLALWITAALREWPVPRLVLVAMIPLLLLTLAETIRRLRGGPELEEGLKRALLLALLPMMILVALLPAPAEPYGYPLLHSIAKTVEQIWHDAETALRFREKGDMEFSLSFNGFSEDANVGEGSETELSSVIYVKPAQAPDGALYLFGNSWNSFDGRGWRSTLRPETAEYLNWGMDTAERIYALWRVLDEEDRAAEFPDYFRSNNVYLVCRRLNVRTMFRVMNTSHVFTDAKRFPYTEAPTGSLFDYVQRGEVWYRVYFLESNVRTRDELIAAAEGTEYKPASRGPYWSEVAESFEFSFFMDLPSGVNMESDYARRTELIRSAYLDSSGVSDRAGALAEEITAGCGGDYEKVTAIAAYLQANYNYVLHPEPVPEGENFLDWLLFEGKEGYCTWYATAAVLMARSVGVPARYVQGYRGELEEGVFTPLVAANAHAWCECYIAGYGWVTVEATPGFTDESVGWVSSEEGEGQNGEGAEGPEDPAEMTDDREDGTDEDLTPLPTPPGQMPKTGESEEDGEPARTRFGWLPILIAVLLPAALAAVWFRLRKRRKRRYAAAEPAARLQMDLEQLLRDLRGKGYPRKPEESLHEYFGRLPWLYLLADKGEAKRMAALYDKVLFGQEQPSEEELAKHRAFAAQFRPKTLKQWVIWYGLQ